jgi:NAD+ synthase
MKNIDPAIEVAKIIEFIQTSFKITGLHRAVLGLSGGVDSATSFALVIKALGPENVYPLLMPYGILSMQGTLDAMTYAQSLVSINNIARIDVKTPADAIINQVGQADNVRRGNIMARIRMTILFDQAKKRQALVMGTENKSEHLLGYYTRYGDEASDIEPIRNYYKTQVYEIAKYLQVPQEILTKAPTAGLWSEQTDEGEFGFTYKEADEILTLLYDENKTETEIINSGYSKDTIERVKSRVEANLFKQNLPYISK